MKEKIFEVATSFSKGSHGSSDYDQDEIYVMGEKNTDYVPLSFLQKSLKDVIDYKELQKFGFCYSSFDFLDDNSFSDWYEKQFSKKVKIRMGKSMGIMHYTDLSYIHKAVEEANKVYDVMRASHIVVNSKNLPIQLGEWYIKNIFGLKQIKSASQRGFDFKLDQSSVEVKVHWADVSSPKGVKVKKSLLELSQVCILVYLAKNLHIRDICYLDSDYILRKLSDKGHTVFLKDQDIAPYFFSKSDKHFNKVVNKHLLMQFATSQFAMKLDGRI